MHEQTGFKTVNDLGGIAKKAPFYIYFAVMLFCKISISRNKWFVSELLVIFGVYEFNHSLGYISALTIIIGASYMLWMFQKVLKIDLKVLLNLI